jgi:hypothetical protein
MPVNPIVLMYAHIKPASKYIPITLTNSQSSATPVPFQQLINISPSIIGSSNFSSDLGNIRFYADSAFTQPLYAWVEYGNSNSSTSTYIWVNLPINIPANSSITIYMKLLPVGTKYDGVYMGEAPQLSSIYGQYDNGARVFNNYWNFSGTSLPSDWTGSGYTVNNGVTVNAPGAVNQTNYIITNTASYNTNQITEFYFPSGFSFGSPTGGTYGINEGWALKSNTGTDRSNIIQVANYYGIGGTDFETVVSGTATKSSSFTSGPSSFISTMYSTSAGAVFGIGTNPPLYNNSQSATLTSNIYTGDSYIYLWSFDSNTKVGPVYYIRTRALPPNNTMPSVSIGSIALFF